MNYPLSISINSIMQPKASATELLNLAADCGFSSIELRNDLPNPRITGDESSKTVLGSIEKTGINVITINALQRFNDPSLFNAKKLELAELITTAKTINCPMIVLCPVNDPGDKRNPEQQHKDLVYALKEYAPIFEKNNMIGLIEPLGFSICSVRTKAQAASAIQETGLSSLYKITHDTFHHYLSGETDFFPELTGLIHISGVLPGKEKSSIIDADRILVTVEDCMGNIEQVKALIDGGYKGPASFEAFSPDVQVMSPSQLKNELLESANLLFS